jgi:hypothetical protein
MEVHQEHREGPDQGVEDKGKKVAKVLEGQTSDGTLNQASVEGDGREKTLGVEEGESSGATNQVTEVSGGKQIGRAGEGLEVKMGVGGQVDAGIADKKDDPIICFRCKDFGHMARDCRKGWNAKLGKQFQEPYHDGPKQLCEMVVSLCATQVDGQAFFLIPDRPSQIQSKERTTTAIITVLKGEMNAKQLEDEFTRLLSGTWRWTARKVSDNKFTMRFPSVQLIKDWSRFNPVKIRTVKAKIQIDQWNGSIGAKAELQWAWFRVRGIPDDKKSEDPAAYAGSLVGATMEVDKGSLHRPDYVRVKIAARDVSKVPEIAEGAIIPFLYDFHYEREIEMDIPNLGIEIPVTSEKGESEPTKENLKEGQSSMQNQGRLEVYIPAGNRSEK